MSLSQCAVSSFKKQLALAVHDFTATTGDVFYMALYSSSASLDADTTAYTSTGEVTGSGYSAGGVAMTSVTPVISGTTVVLDFADVVFTAAVTARGALIYNSSKSNKAVAVLDFGADKTSTTTLTVTMPAATADAAILRIL